MCFSKILTKEFLEAALHKTIKEFEITILTAPGDNYVGNLYRVTVTCDQKETISLVCKSMPDFMKASDAHVREIEVYANTLPAIYVLTEKAWPDMESFAPKLMFNIDGILALEDLNVLGYRTLGRGITLNIELCMLVLKKLARFHAASVMLYINDPDSMKHYDKSVFEDRQSHEGVMRFFTAMLTTLADVVAGWPECMMYADRVRTLSSKLLGKLIAASQNDLTKFNVLNHCDLWVYHSELTSGLVALKYPKQIITFDQLKEEYEKRIAYGAYATFIDLPIMCDNGDFDLHLAMSKGTIPGRKMFDLSTYKEILQYRLPIFDQLGLFD
ncbi:hypothetical protein C0J52_02771 [Blattella germanica]|nr:hypothetical protein C0J52_02771 [Blattella germanica]